MISRKTLPSHQSHYRRSQHETRTTHLPDKRFILLKYAGANLLLVVALCFGPRLMWNYSTTRHLSSNNTKTDWDQITSNPPRKHSVSDRLPLAWLMSFPNSGTSYTSELVRTVTGKNTASNYKDEEEISESVFKDSPEGPFWTGPLNKELIRPGSGYVLTKTHCTGFCQYCPPRGYIENHQTFSRHCFGDTVIEGPMVPYRKDLVKRAVHVLRDPFDNIVSRYHLYRKNLVIRNDTEGMAMYRNHHSSVDGFRAYCNDINERYYDQVQAHTFYQSVLDGIKHVPCHGDFFRYIQWHNLAFTTNWDLSIPTLIIHYENYTANFDETKDALLTFLEQDEIHEPPVFKAGKTYREYFTEEEVKAVSTMVSKLALGKTWGQIAHYFPQ